MKVTLIRHTRVAVPKGTCYGFTDVPVADTFEMEAASTRERLQTIISTVGPIEVAYSSPLTRARCLAAYCGYVDAILDTRLKEMNMGQWEMRLYDEIAAVDPHILDWYQDYMHLRTTGGESFPDLYRRVASFFDELRQKRYKHVAIFAHGGVLACAGIYGGLFPAQEAFNHMTDYGGIEQITIE